jgi:hypothetical protein
MCIRDLRPAAMWMRTAHFWYVTQPVLVIPYRRFGTTCRSQLQGSCDFARTRCTQNPNLAEDLTPRGTASVLKNFYRHYRFWLHLKKKKKHVGVFCFWPAFSLWVEISSRYFAYSVTRRCWPEIFLQNSRRPPTPTNTFFFNRRRISLALTTNTWLGDPGLGNHADSVVPCAGECG